MSAYYNTPNPNFGRTKDFSWLPYMGRWNVVDYRAKRLVSYFAVVDDFGNLQEVPT